MRLVFRFSRGLLLRGVRTSLLHRQAAGEAPAQEATLGVSDEEWGGGFVPFIPKRHRMEEISLLNEHPYMYCFCKHSCTIRTP